MEYKDYDYNFIREKKIIGFINLIGAPVERKEIKEYAINLGIKDRTLSDILKRNVKEAKIKRLSHGMYIGKCKMFYTYDNHYGEARWCINCGQPEAEH
jgi:hypothetical protein